MIEMNKGNHSKEAEVRFFNYTSIELNLVVIREVKDRVRMSLNGSNSITPKYLEQVKMINDSVVNSVEDLSSTSVINTDYIYESMSIKGVGDISVYHDSSVVTKLTTWHIEVDDRSSICPGLFLCTDGIDNEVNLKILAQAIAEGSEIEDEKIIQEIKEQMSTMKL